jgi:biotin-dependent carboxylase-like uncharacterized protein
MALEILKPGLSTTVQDLGRPGYYHLGIPESGGMDKSSLAAANLLVGNPEGAAALEAVFQGPEIRFDRDAVLAVCGAHMPPKVDGVEQPDWTSFTVKSGQTLSFGFLKSGARAYIAVGGGVDVALVLGSRSTYPLGALGGFEGRALKAGDRVKVGTQSGHAKPGRSVPAKLRFEVGGTPELRVLPGLYWHRLTEEAGGTFFEDVWKVAPEADRIGYRFRGGRALSFVPRKPPFGAGSDPSNIVDSCYPYGSIQVPGGTEPIVLHRDAVSGGGYFMLGTVISADMDLIGQLQPHQRTRFVKVDMETALEARAERKAMASQVKERLS